jgi:hypothetical protein
MAMSGEGKVPEFQARMATLEERTKYAVPVTRTVHAHELFILEPGLWQAADRPEIEATCAILRELKLYELPYPTVTVRICAKDIMVVPPHGWDRTDKETMGSLDAEGHPTSDSLFIDITISTVPNSGCEIVAYNSLSGIVMKIMDVPKTGALSLRSTSPAYRERLRAAVCDFLIALLATKNIVKTRHVDKLAKLGIGKKRYKHRYTYTTTLRVPRHEECEDDDSEHKPTGKHKIPHLRRAHLRRQHYGPGFKFYKQILIPSVFVNADADFVSQREAYNVGLGRLQQLEGDDRHE